MEETKVLLSYDFRSEMNNTGNNKYSFSDFGNSAYDLINGFIGGLLASTNTFKLNQNWSISFYYQWRSQLSRVWDHLFAFGTHKSSDVGVDIVSYAIGIMNVKPGVQPLYIIPTIDTNKHFYEIKYSVKTLTLSVYIDNKLVNTLTDIVMPNEQFGLYLSGGANGINLNCKINDFLFIVQPELIYIQISSSTKTNIIQTIYVSSDTLEPGETRFVEYHDIVSRSITRTFNKEFASLDEDGFPRIPSRNARAQDAIPVEKLKTYVDGDYLVNLNFDANRIEDFGSLKFTWTKPDGKYFVPSKLSENNPIKKSLEFDGTYYIQSYRGYLSVPKIEDFCVEIDFLIDDNLHFSTPYSRVYLSSANLNTYGEYHSTLADFYLLPKYKDDDSLLSLTVESNDLYRNTGNIIYTYGWIKRNTPYRIIYVRNGNRFYMLVNDELVFDETLTKTITYEPGYSKPNRRYLGGNYLPKLDIGLGRSVYPTNIQDPLVGYIDKFNISGVARFDDTGYPVVFVKEVVVTTAPIIKTYSAWMLIYKRCITIAYGEKFVINGYTIIGGIGGTRIVGTINGKIIIYSGSGIVEIIKHAVVVNGVTVTAQQRYFVNGGGYYGVIYNGIFTRISYTVEFVLINIIYEHTVFITEGETFVYKGITVIGPVGGCILIPNPTGGYMIKSHTTAVTIIYQGVTHIVRVGYTATISVVTGVTIIGSRGFPIPIWVRVITNPYYYPPYMIQYIESDILVYVPCKDEDFNNDVIYSKVVPRDINYQAYKVRGKFYRDYWREGYGAIGSK